MPENASRRPLRSGVFIAPFHPADEDPTEQIHRDLDLVKQLDEQGYDEAWIGEHHSGGYEIIPSPELFIAHAAAIIAHSPHLTVFIVKAMSLCLMCYMQT